MTKLVLRLFLVFIGCTALTLAEVKEPLVLARRWIRIDLRVKSEGHLMKDVKSLLSREFRSLGDVELTDKDPTHIINVQARTTTVQRGDEVGFAVSFIVARPAEVSLQESEFYTGIDTAALVRDYPDSMEAIAAQTNGALKMISHFVIGGPATHVESQCKSAVASIDTQILDADRANARKLDETLRSLGREVRRE